MLNVEDITVLTIYIRFGAPLLECVDYSGGPLCSVHTSVGATLRVLNDL